MIIVFTAVFHEKDKYYLQIFLDECLYNTKMLYFDKIDISEGIDVNKISESK